MSRTVKVGLIGSGFVADIHAHAFRHFVPDAEVIAVASPTPGKAAEFARARGIPHAFEDYRQMLAMPEIDMVTLSLPNDLHCQATLDAAAAGKHVVCEKPLCRTLEEADRMIEACRRAGVLLMYAEELLFAPKYVRAKQLVDEGALGRPFLVKQWEEHYGPHSPWFWDVNRSGGGVLLDMGCHSIEYARWVFGKPPVRSVSATLGTFVHGDRTEGEDHAIVVVEYEGNRIALAENSWAKPGGVDDRAEIYGSRGHTRADLLRGNALITYSDVGYGYATEKMEITTGWTFTMFEEIWNYGFPQEMQHFVNCVLGKEEPMETGEDGREVLKIILAAYQSAGEGRKIAWPYEPPAYDKPIDLWKRHRD
ncbi:MAG: Gfo/Idh/MocA family oxidoreductase [Chloroherpetonaceae bacterium]|nr:Gfo/Idh/MocA family oxidoreductase [Chthonomonadaceae bacterium]MDW8209437.1 Gfo/Idh/MocA family oxidoreductase [Chloroherpetonaceae bacterium]